jgi:hypothetical protein
MPFIGGGGGGGGGTPAGSNTQIQYNNANAFGASADLTFTTGGVTTLGLAAAAAGSAIITTIGRSAEMLVRAADGDATHAGGGATLRAGGSTGANGGDVTIRAGNDTAAGDGGSIDIRSGTSVGADGGSIRIEANEGAVAGGAGGDVTVAGGSGTGSGGDVIIQGGSTNGSVQVYSGDSNQYIQLDNAGLQIGATKLGFFQGAAVVQPTGVAVTAAAIHAALVSLGLITA